MELPAAGSFHFNTAAAAADQGDLCSVEAPQLGKHQRQIGLVALGFRTARRVRHEACWQDCPLASFDVGIGGAEPKNQ